MFFDGDIIITDPCYIMKEEKIIDYSTRPILDNFYSEEYRDIIDYYSIINPFEKQTYIKELMKRREDPKAKKEYNTYYKAAIQWEKDNAQDWEKCEYGMNLEVLGFINYLSSNTLYGDWSCSTFELKEPKITKYCYELKQKDFKSKLLGKFCADAGMVSVLYLKDVLNYNPNFDYHINNKYTTTWIENFKGNISIEIETEELQEDSEVFILGEGNINFITRQTGF